TPDAQYYGPDTFTYQASNGTLASTTATVALTVDQLPPVVTNAIESTSEDSPLMIPAPGVLSHDTDPNHLPLTAVPFTGPSHGSLTLNSDGSFTYIPDPQFFGLDSFSYKASDGNLLSGPATVTVSVIPLPPVSPIDGYSTIENVP